MEVFYLFGLVFFFRFFLNLAPFLLLSSILAYFVAGPLAIIAVIFLWLMFHRQKKYGKQKSVTPKNNYGWETLNKVKPPFKKLIDLGSDLNEL